MDTRNKKTITVLMVLVAVTLSFIWAHSFMGMEESAEESGFFYELLCPFFELFMGEGNVTELFIRKLAHFTEFFALGLELMLLMKLVFMKMGWKILFNSWVLGTFCALIDETIQIFSGRGSQIQDVWLDSAGCMAGVLVMTGGILLFRKKKKTKQ